MIDYKNPPQGLFVYRTEAHFDQLDTQFILHHSRQVRLIERAYFSMFKELMNTPVLDHEKYPDLNVVVKKLEMEFIQPLRGMIPFMIALKILKVRSSGISTAFEFRSADGKTLFTKGIREVCKIRFDAPEPCFWTDEFYERSREMLEAGKSL